MTSAMVCKPLGHLSSPHRFKEKEEKREIKRARRQAKKTPGPVIPAVESEDEADLPEGVRLAEEPHRHAAESTKLLFGV